MKKFILGLSLAIPPAFIPAWKMAAAIWTTRVLFSLGYPVKTDLQENITVAIAETVFLIPIFLYILWVFFTVMRLFRDFCH